ncbi:MAG: CPBP family intramembrane glutamic endopeptidase [Anaerolineae bacterium]|nr:CPBP family intramembrane metalloprotease [Anaerolineae bacterium]
MSTLRSSAPVSSGSFVKRYQVLLFFILAFLLSWLVWETYILEQQGRISFHLPDSFFAYFALTAAVLIVAALAGGRAAITELWQRLIRWRVDVQWYVLALLVPILLAAISAVVSSLLGSSVPTGIAMSLGGAVSYFFLFGAKLWITEELAWRGFVLPRLQARMSALPAALLLGLLWGVWHTPLFLINGTGQSTWPYLGFVLFAMADSVLVSWIFNNTHGSILLVTIFHAATDAALSFSGVLSGDQSAFWITVVIHVIAAVVVVVVEGATYLSRAHAADPAIKTGL